MAEMEQISLDEARVRLGDERFVEVLDGACGCLPYARDGKFQFDPADELGFGASYEYDSYLAGKVMAILDGVDRSRTAEKDRRVQGAWKTLAAAEGMTGPEREGAVASARRSLERAQRYDEVRVEVYGKPFDEIVKGMNSVDAARELERALEDAVLQDVWENYVYYPNPGWEEDRYALTEALADALQGCEVDVVDVTYDELLNILDEAGLTDWDLPAASDVPLTVEVHLGDLDAGLSPEEVRAALVDRESDLADLDRDDLEATPIIQLARQQGVGPEDIRDAGYGDETVAGSIKREIANATGSDYGFDVVVPCTLTAGQVVALEHGGAADALALTPADGALVQMTNSFEGCCGGYGVDLARPLPLAPTGSGSPIEVSRVRLVDLDERGERAHDWTLEDICGFAEVHKVYGPEPRPEAEAVAAWALGDIASKEVGEWEAAGVGALGRAAERSVSVYGHAVGIGVAPASTDGKALDALDVSVHALDDEPNVKTGKGTVLRLELAEHPGCRDLARLLEKEAPAFAGGAAKGIAGYEIDMERERACDALGRADEYIEGSEATVGTGLPVHVEEKGH